MVLPRKSQSSSTAGNSLMGMAVETGPVRGAFRGRVSLRVADVSAPLIIVGVLALLCTFHCPVCRGNAGTAGHIAAHVEFRLEQYSKASRVRILQARTGSPLLAMRNGVIGYLSARASEIIHGLGTPWNQLVMQHSGHRPMPVTMFADPPSVSPDGEYFVALVLSGSQAPSAAKLNLHAEWQTWSLKGRRIVNRLFTTPPRAEPIPPRGPQRLVYTDAGHKLAGFGGGCLYFLAAETMKFRASSAPLSSYHVIRLCAEPEGKYLLAFCTQPGRVEVWNGKTEKRVVIIPPPPGIQWGPRTREAIGGNKVAVSWGHNLAVYDADTGHCIACLRLHGTCHAPAFTSDGSVLAVCTVASAPHKGGRQTPKGAASSRIQVFTTKNGLALAGASPIRQIIQPDRFQITWWGHQALVECSEQHVAIWHLSWSKHPGG